MRLAPLGEDLAVPLVVEAIDHHPVVAGQVLEDARGLVAQRAQRRRAEDGLHCVIDMPGEVDWRTDGSSSTIKAALRRTMEQAVEIPRRLADIAVDSDRDLVERLPQIRLRSSRTDCRAIP